MHTWDGKWGVGRASPPPPIWVSILVHAFDPPLQGLAGCIRDTPHIFVYEHKSTNKGGVGQTPPPPPPVGVRSILVKHALIEPPLQDSWICQCTRVWTMPCISVRHTPPPPPVWFRFVYSMHLNPIWSFLAICHCIHVIYTTYIGLRLSVNKYGVRGATPRASIGFRFVYMHSNPISRWLCQYIYRIVACIQRTRV